MPCNNLRYLRNYFRGVRLLKMSCCLTAPSVSLAPCRETVHFFCAASPHCRPVINSWPYSHGGPKYCCLFPTHAFFHQKSWTFIAQNRAQRDEWITALIDAMEQTGDMANSDEADVVPEAAASAADAGNVSVDAVYAAMFWCLPRFCAFVLSWCLFSKTTP